MTPAPLTTAGATARTGTQVIGAASIVTGLQLFGVTHFTAEQATWLTGALTTLAAFAQRLVEAKLGRAWLRPTDPPTQ